MLLSLKRKVTKETLNWHSFKYSVYGGDDGIRTHDPLLAGQVLSQLSYTPILNSKFEIPNSKLLGFAFFSDRLFWDW